MFEEGPVSPTLHSKSEIRNPKSTVSLAIEGMHCASCVSTIEGALAELPGVSEASVNLGTARAQVTGKNLDTRRLIQAVRASGYEARLAAETSPHEQQARANRETREYLRRTIVSSALA
ncbi:MAG TPA: heavy metal-associated domain-containing protein, partial [Thermoanaerobaculia bacterium]|nr:heavy metal-associated domain-containing protein [Thermoanaerobaculia bacterium]